jgi:hypothetical protein
MQIIGGIGLLSALWYSAAVIVGAGIGSPNGQVHSDYYGASAIMISIPLAMIIIGWLWVTIAYLRMPFNKPTKKLAEQVAASDR